MDIIEDYLKCSVVLVETDYTDTTAPLIIKTHNYRGEKSKEFYCKERDINNKNVNRTMFKPFHLQIVSPSKKVIGHTKDGNIGEDFLANYMAKYNKADVMEDVLVLFNLTKFIPVLSEDSKLSLKIGKYYFSNKELKEKIQQFGDFLIKRNRAKASSGNAEIRKTFDTWLQKDIETYIQQEIELKY